MKNLCLFSITALLGACMINSCSIERRYHRTGFNVNWNNASIKMMKDKNSNNSENYVISEEVAKTVRATENPNTTYADISDNSVANNSNEPILTNERNSIDLKLDTKIKNEVDYDDKIQYNSHKEETTSTSSKMNKNRIGKNSEMKELVKQKASSGDDNTILCIVLAFFIPPLAVYLYDGNWTKRCTINLVLTLLCGFPGLIHALIIILGGK
ncbi:MAG: YqaE/Pmp3 family membrane protein [Bacteroidota bacterium]